MRLDITTTSTAATLKSTRETWGRHTWRGAGERFHSALTTTVPSMFHQYKGTYFSRFILFLITQHSPSTTELDQMMAFHICTLAYASRIYSTPSHRLRQVSRTPSTWSQTPNSSFPRVHQEYAAPSTVPYPDHISHHAPSSPSPSPRPKHPGSREEPRHHS